MMSFKIIRDMTKNLIRDWKAMSEASRHLPDPPDYKPSETDINFKNLRKLTPKMWWLIWTETFELAYLRYADPKKAYKIAKDDSDLLKKLEEDHERSHPEMKTRIKTWAENIKRESPKYFKHLDELNRPEDAVKYLKENKGTIQSFIMVRMETMGEALAEFMKGYRESKEQSRLAAEDGEYINNMMEPFKEGFEDIQQGKNPSSLVNKLMEPFQSEIDKIQKNKDNLYLNKILKQGLKDAEHLKKYIQPLKDGFQHGQIKNPNDGDTKTKVNKDYENIHDVNDKSMTDNSIEKDKTESTNIDKTTGSKT